VRTRAASAVAKCWVSCRPGGAQHDGQRWRPLSALERLRRLCGNAAHDACDWLVPAAARATFCQDCRPQSHDPGPRPEGHRLRCQPLKAASTGWCRASSAPACRARQGFVETWAHYLHIFQTLDRPCRKRRCGRCRAAVCFLQTDVIPQISTICYFCLHVIALNRWSRRRAFSLSWVRASLADRHPGRSSLA